MSGINYNLLRKYIASPWRRHVWQTHLQRGTRVTYSSGRGSAGSVNNRLRPPRDLYMRQLDSSPTPRPDCNPPPLRQPSSEAEEQGGPECFGARPRLGRSALASTCPTTLPARTMDSDNQEVHPSPTGNSLDRLPEMRPLSTSSVPVPSGGQVFGSTTKSSRDCEGRARAARIYLYCRHGSRPSPPALWVPIARFRCTRS